MISKVMFLCLVGASLIATLNGAFGETGGISLVVSDDETMLDMLKQAIHKYNNEHHDGMTHHMKVFKVDEAKKQVVSGLKYHIKFDLMKTKCAKRDSITMEEFDNCRLDDTMLYHEQPHHCTISFVYQAWSQENKINIESLKCTNQYWS